MPAILALEAWPAWLGQEQADPPQLKALLAPYPADGMTAWPVSSRVGNIKNNDPGLIEPIAAHSKAVTSRVVITSLLILLALAGCTSTRLAIAPVPPSQYDRSDMH
jgi:SOS response associated peptidase (SRAP)